LRERGKIIVNFDLPESRRIMMTIVYLTRGERLYEKPSKAVAEKRAEEARRVSEVLGCRDIIFLGIPDGGISLHADEAYGKLHEIFNKRKPDLVFSPSPVDYHKDHIATSEVALRLLNATGSFKLAFYEVYSALRFTHLIDITEVIEKKKQIILNYCTSLYDRPELFVDASLGLNAHRSIFMQKPGYYEAFYVIEEEADMESVLNDICYRGT
jgi:LmbE family N-acetylglucosaminyl deacetylase